MRFYSAPQCFRRHPLLVLKRTLLLSVKPLSACRSSAPISKEVPHPRACGLDIWDVTNRVETSRMLSLKLGSSSVTILSVPLLRASTGLPLICMGIVEPEVFLQERL